MEEFIKDFVNSIYKVGNNIANISTGYNNLEEKRIINKWYRTNSYVDDA